MIKKGNVIFPEGRTLLYYMILPTGRKLVDSQGDPTAGTLKATASEVGPRMNENSQQKLIDEHYLVR